MISIHIMNISDPLYTHKKKIRGHINKSKAEEVVEILEVLKHKAFRGGRINVDKEQIEFCI